MQKWIFLAGIVAALWPSAAPAQSRCVDLVGAAWSNPQTTDEEVAVKLSAALDCESQAPNLSRLGAEYLVLKRVGVHLDATKAADFQLKPSPNPYELGKGHQLLLPFHQWRSQNWNLDRLMEVLASDIFPKILSTSTVSLGFDAVVNQAIDFADTPPAGFVEKKGNYYEGSLTEPFDFFLASSREFPALRGAVTSEVEWAQLQSELDAYTTCPTRCLLRMERRVLQGLFIVMGRAELVRHVFDRNFSELRPSRLPKTYGCNNSYMDRPTGAYMSYQADQPYYFDYGISAFPGRTLYIQAINYPAVTDGIMRGQNGILRSITPAALAELRALGGFGADSGLAHQLEPQMNQWSEEAVNKQFSGLSRQMILYWLARKAGRDVDAAKIIDRPVFNEISFSEGKTLRWWVEYGYRRNPGTPYQIFGLDYGFHLSPRGRDSIYDRLIVALKNW